MKRRGITYLTGKIIGGSSESRIEKLSKYTCTYGMGTTAVTMFVLPANVDIIGIDVNVNTAFNAETSAVLDIGKSGTANHFKNDLDVATPAVTNTGWSNLGHQASSLTIVAQLTQVGTAATAGSADVIFHWVEH